MEKKAKVKLIIFAVISLAGIILLASTLSSLQFSPGYRISTEMENTKTVGNGSRQPVSGVVKFIFRIIFPVLMISGIIFFIVSLFIKHLRKKVILRLIGMLIIVLILSLIHKQGIKFSKKESLDMDFEIKKMKVENGKKVGDADEKPPDWVVTLVSLLIVSSISAAAFFLWKWAHRRFGKEPVQRLAEEARQSLDRIEAGSDIRDTVIRCYIEMIKLLDYRKGIQRGEEMTPREFEFILLKAGLPENGVRGITRFFERVRYGSMKLTPEEEKQAVDCLASIAQACGGDG